MAKVDYGMATSVPLFCITWHRINCLITRASDHQTMSEREADSRAEDYIDDWICRNGLITGVPLFALVKVYSSVGWMGSLFVCLVGWFQNYLVVAKAIRWRHVCHARSSG